MEKSMGKNIKHNMGAGAEHLPFRPRGGGKKDAMSIKAGLVTLVLSLPVVESKLHVRAAGKHPGR